MKGYSFFIFFKTDKFYENRVCSIQTLLDCNFIFKLKLKLFVTEIYFYENTVNLNSENIFHQKYFAKTKNGQK